MLPAASSSPYWYAALRLIFLDHTAVSGELPAQWGHFQSLEQLTLQNTTLACPLTVVDGQVRAPEKVVDD
jgi:hypothetical protein